VYEIEVTMSTAPATCIRTLRLKVKSEAHSWLNAAAIEVHQDAGDFYRNSELQIAQLQRRGHKSQVERLHRKVARRRKDALHKFSRKIVNQYQNIVIGDVSSAKLIKTPMAKSVHDAGDRGR
jgi:transposase